MQKMGPKGARKGPGRPAWSPWAGRPSPFRSPIGLGRPGVLGPAGLALFGAQSVSVFFSTKYASTLIYVLPKPPTISTYKYPEAAVKEEGIAGSIQGDRRERASRDTFELDTRERRHRRPHHPSAPLQVGGQQGIHPLPEISLP